MNATVDYVARVCIDCYMAHHYGARYATAEETISGEAGWYAGESDTPADREPLALLPPGRYVADDTGEDDTADDGFSWRSCDGCGSTLGGDRFRLAVFGPEPAPEPVAVAAVTAYAVLDGEGGTIHAGNVEAFPATDDPDSLADTILRELVIPDGIATPSAAFPSGWRQSGGDDHGDGLTSWDYVADLADLDAVAAILDYAGSSEPGDGTPYLGILRGPEEGGTIPGGMTWNLDGMDWNVGGVTRIAGADVAVFPVTVAAADAVFGPGWREGGEGS